MEILVIGAVRVLGSLPVLRWAFVGALLAIAVDFSDLFLKNLLDLGGLKDYQRFDKLADVAYMTCFLAVAWRWSGVERAVALGLFAFRMAALVLFELTGARPVLLLFPNVFEFWFVLIAWMKHWRPAVQVSKGWAPRWVVILLVPKLGQEYVLHYGQWLDSFTAVEAVEAIWEFLTGWL